MLVKAKKDITIEAQDKHYRLKKGEIAFIPFENKKSRDKLLETGAIEEAKILSEDALVDVLMKMNTRKQAVLDYLKNN